MMLVLFLNLLHDAFDFNGFPIINARLLLEGLQRRAHAIKCLRDFTTLVGYETLSEKTSGACFIIVNFELFAEPIQDNCEVLLSFIVEDERDLNLVVLCHYHKVVLNDVVFPDLDDLREESLCILTLASLQEKLSHVEIGSAQVD